MSNRLRSAIAYMIAAFAGTALGCSKPREPAPAPARYSIHEWGLVAVDAAEPNVARLATEVAGGFRFTESPRGNEPRGHGAGTGYGGKPVLYVHLEPGFDEAIFDVRLGIPSAKIVERWPAGGALGRTDVSGWQRVVARRGACASATPPPTATSAECTNSRDGFCEAAEIPRYYGAHASCLEVGDSRSELLFYRAEGIPTDRLPLQMVSENGSFRPSRVKDDAIAGPVFFITAAEGGSEVAIHLLEADALDRAPLESGVGSRLVDPETAKDLIRMEAVQRGLSESEADAFADAWAPAVFARCKREGPEAVGTIPAAFEQSTSSLVYFAPTEIIDAMVPLSASPAPARIKRAFLVRYVDGRSTIRPEGALRVFGELTATPPRTDEGSASRPSNLFVRLGNLRVETRGLTTDQVRRVAQRNVSQLRACADAVEAPGPTFGGRIPLRMMIAPDGRVAMVESEGRLREESFELCVLRSFRSLNFPMPNPPGPVRVRYEIEFGVRAPD